MCVDSRLKRSAEAEKMASRGRCEQRSGSAGTRPNLSGPGPRRRTGVGDENRVTRPQAEYKVEHPAGF